MAKDVFISYAKGDREWAEQVCAQLEESGIGCWIAPRDIAPGVTWPAAITDAIRQCRAMIVVFSHHANESRQMAREVEVADSRHVPILPVRVEEIEPAGDMEYFLGNRQWFDLHGGKVERRRALPDAITSLLGQLELTGIAPDGSAGPPVPFKAPAKSGMPKWVPVALVAVLAAVGVAAYSLRPKPEGTPTVQAPAPQNATPESPAVSTAAPVSAPETAKKTEAAESVKPKSQPGTPAKQVAAAPVPTGAEPVAGQPPAAKPSGNFDGKWQAEVKYSWGVVHKEVYQFKVDEGEVIGTASYVGTPRGILEGKIDGNRISFLTKSQTMLGNDTYQEKHAYKGRLNGDAIEFVLQTDSGYDSRTPEMFTAKRIE